MCRVKVYVTKVPVMGHEMEEQMGLLEDGQRTQSRYLCRYMLEL